MPLDIYISSPIEAIYILLDKIYRDEISAFVNTFLKQYILNNNLQNDSVLSAYIQVCKFYCYIVSIIKFYYIYRFLNI